MKRQWMARLKFTSFRSVPAPPAFCLNLTLAREPDRVVRLELDAVEVGRLRESIDRFFARHGELAEAVLGGRR